MVPNDPEDDDPPEDEQTEEEDGDSEEEESSEQEEETSDEQEEETSDEEGAKSSDEEESESEDGAAALPDIDEDVYASRDAWDAADEDFEDDAGDWTCEDYEEVATTLFGAHEFFGDTAHARYVDEGYAPVTEDVPWVAEVRSRVPEGAAIRFFEKDGRAVPRGFLTSAALALLESSFPDLVLDLLHVTVARRPLEVAEAAAVRGGLPDALRNREPADAVDLRKYATPVGDQGSTSRCAAFAWTHALEMLGNIHSRPLPRLACSFTMYHDEDYDRVGVRCRGHARSPSSRRGRRPSRRA